MFCWSEGSSTMRTLVEKLPIVGIPLRSGVVAIITPISTASKLFPSNVTVLLYGFATVFSSLIRHRQSAVVLLVHRHLQIHDEHVIQRWRGEVDTSREPGIMVAPVDRPGHIGRIDRHEPLNPPVELVTVESVLRAVILPEFDLDRNDVLLRDDVRQIEE